MKGGVVTDEVLKEENKAKTLPLSLRRSHEIINAQHAYILDLIEFVSKCKENLTEDEEWRFIGHKQKIDSIK